MESSQSPLLRLAEAIADGSDIDWQRAEASAANAGESAIVRQLKTLATVGAVHRAALTTWGPLQIRGQVGEGTFGTVYRALDVQLDREVALKLMHDDGRSDLASVIKEARLLARIRHPHVVTVHGADEFDGRVGVWMEFVTGRTLKQIVHEQGPFGAYEAALIGRDLCRALAAVHKLGFVHRDVKAQNVMREAGGRTVLMDFGAGEATAGVAAAPMAGTPVYLAPEMLDGATASPCTDLYSLGVLLFHLVSGEFPVTGNSLAELRHHHAQRRRTLLRDVRPDLPSAFVQLVDRATATDPAERPESAGDMEAQLEGALGLAPKAQTARWRRQFAYVAMVASLVILMAAVVRPYWNGGATVRRTSVAILPFKNLSADPDNEYFSAGVTADIASQLTRLRELRVIGGHSVARDKWVTKSLPEIARELGVSAIVEGSVRRSGDRVRIVSQLFDAQTGEQLWSDIFDRDITDIFQIQADVSRKIAVALKGELSVAEAGWLSPRRDENFEAFNLYLKGRYHWSLRSEDGFRRSLQYFEEALARYPHYALAHAGLADTFSMMGAAGVMPKEEAAARASEAAARAVALDPSLAEAHASLGYIQSSRFEWAAAEASLKRAIELKPGYAPAHHWYSVLLSQLGRFSESIAEVKTALALDPLAISANAQLGTVLLLARRYDDAVVQFQKVMAMDPTYSAAHQVIGEAYCYKGEYDLALASYKKAASVAAIGREDHEQRADLGYALALAGRRHEANEVLAELLRRQKTTPRGTAANIATLYTAFDQRDLAFQWLAVALSLRDPEVGYLKVDPRWDPLRHDHRFGAILAEIGLTANETTASP